MKTKRQIKKSLKVRFDLIENDPSLSTYRKGGEYSALKWLKAFVEGRASSEPIELLMSAIRASAEYGERRYNADYMSTILRYAA